MIDGHLAHVNDVLSLQKSGQTFERQSVLSKCPWVEFLLASGEVLLDALNEWCPGDGVALNLRLQRGTQSLRSLKVRELRALPRNDISARRATMNPDWALTFHPKPALLARHASLMDKTVLEVSFVQN
jgi:hypothetical protein